MKNIKNYIIPTNTKPFSKYSPSNCNSNCEFCLTKTVVKEELVLE